MKSFLRQPLLHFFLIGIALFGVYGVGSRQNPIPRISSDVAVSTDDLIKLLQSREPGANPDDLKQQFGAMTKDERLAVIEDYLWLEIYYREAAFLGLDADSFAVKEQMAKEFENVVRSGFEGRAGDRMGEERERYFQESMANAWSQIKSSYNITIMVDDPQSAGESNEE